MVKLKSIYNLFRINLENGDNELLYKHDSWVLSINV